MRRSGITTRIVLSFLVIIAFMGTLTSLLGYWVIRTNIIDRAQNQLRNQLSAARSVFFNERDRIELSFKMIAHGDTTAPCTAALDLDYCKVAAKPTDVSFDNPHVSEAFSGKSSGGLRIIDSAELRHLGDAAWNKAYLAITPTPMARSTGKNHLAGAMVVEYAVPIVDANSRVIRVVYGGKIINRDSTLIDRINRIVFENDFYNGKPLGTVTIFQDDVRIATNVLDKNGLPALGTQVSAIVYDKVIGQARPWYSRAFVVTDWYFTAYEPLYDVRQRIVGMLYVGALEAPFTDMIKNTLAIFLLIITGCMVFAFVLTLFLSRSITRPLRNFVKATTTFARGDFTHKVPDSEKIAEVHELSCSFNTMADTLHERDQRLTSAMDTLATLNKRYVDLVTLVSHELKGLLSSTVLNTLSVRDEHLGPLNQAQIHALSSVARTLDYFELTVKNFLNLSKIEKNELTLSLSQVHLKTGVVDEAVDSFLRLAREKEMTIQNNVPLHLALEADTFQLLMIINNLVGNAIKYGRVGGTIIISAQEHDGVVDVDVYNDGRPLTGLETAKLFKRFSRLESKETQGVRGTGLGLFLCQEIALRHKGTMQCIPRQSGNSFLVTLPQKQSTAVL